MPYKFCRTLSFKDELKFKFVIISVHTMKNLLLLFIKILPLEKDWISLTDYISIEVLFLPRPENHRK